MKEAYLHAIWRMRRLPVKELYTTDGQQLTLIDPGMHNLDAGPDFFNGTILLDGIKWNGNIEIHLKSSDWYAHGHHRDSAYHSVILHVVLHHDKEVLLNGKAIPTLEISDLLDFKHWELYEKLQQSQQWIPCSTQLQTIQQKVIATQIETSSLNRLKRKFSLNQIRYVENGMQLFPFYLEIYATVFGMKVNELPFIELTKRLDQKMIQRSSTDDLIHLFLGIAGFLDCSSKTWKHLKNKYQLCEMDASTWKFKGLRPASFPPKKIIEFAQLCSNPRFFSIHDLEAKELIHLVETLPFSSNTKKLLLINAFVPILWWQATRLDKPSHQKMCLELLKSIPAENNSTILSWKKLGINPKSSFETQGLLELKNELCNKKKCLTCKIGKHVLNG